MEVIRKGRLPETYMHEGSCSKCKCVVRFSRGEGKVVSDQRDGDYVWITCPTRNCGTAITSQVSSGR